MVSITFMADFYYICGFYYIYGWYTRTSPLVSFVWLLTFLSTTSTFVLEALVQVIGLPMVTNGAPLFADLFLHTFEYDSWSKQWNRALQKPPSSATPFGTSTIYSVFTMQTLEITSAQFTGRNWNLRTPPHQLLKCAISTRISWLRRHKCTFPYQRLQWERWLCIPDCQLSSYGQQDYFPPIQLTYIYIIYYYCL